MKEADCTQYKVKVEYLYNSILYLDAQTPGFPLIPSPGLLSSQPPCSQRQCLQLHRRRPNVAPKRHHAYYHTHYICDIVAVSRNIAASAAVYASMLLGFGDAREGSGDKGEFEVCRGFEGRVAGGDGEDIDKL